MNRVERIDLFRERLKDVLDSSGEKQSAFAESIGVDRSTLSQLLSPSNNRLPRADTIAAIAATYQVSADWLLGLSQGGPMAADIMRQPLEIERATHSPVDDLLERWREEAVGYKIRYIPADLPDLIKSEEVIRYEFESYGPDWPEQNLEKKESRLAYQRRPDTELEVCQSIQSIEGFVRGEGMWSGLSAEARQRQVDYMAALADELYPRFRWYLYDGRKRFSAPFTVFGNLRAALYIGHFFFVFNGIEHIRVLSQRFDDLIRAASVQAHEVGDVLRSLKAEAV